MSIRQKFNEFKKEVKDVYNKDLNMKSLDITTLNVNELYNSGYFERKIDSFLYFNEFGNKDFNEFFYDECSEIQLSDMSHMQGFDNTCQIADFIRIMKIETARYRIFSEFLDFITLLKEERINKN